MTLRPVLKDIDGGLVTVVNERGRPELRVWKSVFDKRAPHAKERVEEIIAPVTIGAGTVVTDITDELLSALRAAYEEAAAPADTVVVAARDAYPEYQRYSAYICQEGRSFREGLQYLGFYTNHAIQREIPVILRRQDHFLIAQEHADELRASEDPIDRSLAALVDRLVADGDGRVGKTKQVFLLTPHLDEQTRSLQQPIRHEGPAWTMGQRYARLELLERARSTLDLE